MAAGVLRRQNLRQMEVDGRLEEQTLFRHQRTRMEAWNCLDRGYQRSSRSNPLLDHVTGVNRVTLGVKYRNTLGYFQPVFTVVSY
jgi:hypothetical protein